MNTIKIEIKKTTLGNECCKSQAHERVNVTCDLPESIPMIEVQKIRSFMSEVVHQVIDHLTPQPLDHETEPSRLMGYDGLNHEVIDVAFIVNNDYDEKIWWGLLNNEACKIFDYIKVIHNPPPHNPPK